MAKWFSIILWLQAMLSSAVSNSQECCRISGTPTTMTYIYDCANCNLKKVPKDIPDYITSLILRNNSLDTSKGSPFKQFTLLEHLDISKNDITNFTQTVYVGLSNLKSLDMRQDGPPDLTEGVFAPLIKLETLKLGGIHTRGQPFPWQWIPSLGLHLKFLEMSVPRMFVFPKDFAAFKKLESLIITGNNCGLQNVTDQTFEVFRNTSLKTLEIKRCYLQGIKPKALMMFSHLRNLNFACNYHKNLDFQEMFASVRNLPTASLETLVIDGSGRKTLNALTADEVDSPAFSNLRRFSARSTRIISLDFNVLNHVPNLEHINLGFNTIVQVIADDTDMALNQTVILLNSMNVSTVDISYFGSVMGESNSFRGMFCSDPKYTDEFFAKPPSFVRQPLNPITGDREIDYSRFERHEDFLEMNVPHSFRYVFAKKIGISRDDFSGFSFNPNNILHIDFSNNQLTSISGRFIGFENLQSMVLDSTSLTTIAHDAFNEAVSLVSLHLSMNYFTSDSIDFLKHIGNNTMLKFLDLSGNWLKEIGEHDYSNIKSLEMLNLSNNHISNIYSDFAGNPNLKMLDLSNCSLTYIHNDVTAGLDKLQRESGDFKIALKGNPWACNCTSFGFLQWIKSTRLNIIDKDTLVCSETNSTLFPPNTNLFDVDLAQLDKICHPKLSLAVVIAVPTLLILASLLATTMAYHHRWTLKWQFYLIKRKVRITMMKKSAREDQLIGLNSDSRRTYDAFVSYNHEADYEWVQSALVDKIEDTWNLKLCIGQRDFLVGVPIAENICEAIDNSRFTILIITPAFVSSGWCDFELHMALTRGRKHLIIIYKEDIDVSETSTTLRTLLRSVNYIEYSENPDGQAMFWQRLHDALTAKPDNSILIAKF